MRFIDSSGVKFECAVDFGTATVDLGDATVTLPTGQYAPIRWVSDLIDEGDIVGGATSEAIAVPGTYPTGVIPIAAYLVTTKTTTSSNAGTTGLTLSLGISGATSGYLAAGANLVSTAAGRKENAVGTLVGGYRSGDSLLLTLTATGGAANTAHISALGVKVVVYYLSVATEWSWWCSII